MRCASCRRPAASARRLSAGDLTAERLHHVRRERLIAAQLLGLDLDSRLAGEAQRAVADRAGVERAHLVVAFEAEALRQPGHGRGRNAGTPRLLAHRQQGDVVRAVEHVARRRLQLRRQRLERLDDQAGERTGHVSAPLEWRS